MQTTIDPIPSVISTREVLHRADVQGDVITRVDVVAYGDKRIEVVYWHNWQTGKLVRLTSREIA